MTWIDAMADAELEVGESRVVRAGGRQMLIVRTPSGVRACSNRCPHEGFPLSEGELRPDGTLRCNWHNWTFDLETGETLVGGDRLQQFPVRIDGGRIFVAPVRPDAAAVRESALAGIVAALGDADHPRMLREMARLELAGFDGTEAVAMAVEWLAPRLRYGTTHAIAGAADWLALASAAETSPDRRLAAIGEILGHISDDGRREARYPYATETAAWDRAAFLSAIEACDEAAALARIRGALADGTTLDELFPTLATAALSHYAGFGHALIYVVKSVELDVALGGRASEAIACLLVRGLCVSVREDLLPKFRGYAGALATAREATATVSDRSHLPPPVLTNVSVAGALAAVAAWPARFEPQAIFRSLVDSAALALRDADEPAMMTTSGPIAADIGWLDYTHAITFAEAGERAARRSPELWPEVLLQIACFIGRNGSTVVSPGPDLSAAVSASDPPATIAALRESLFDHGRDTFIVSVHLIKTLVAASHLIDSGHAEPGVLAAALDRFFTARLKRRHVLRAARQMLALASDGV